MSLKCNIDARGQVFRIAVGTIVLSIGLILLIASIVRGGTAFTWTLSIAAMLLGGFMIFEGRAGWCVIRAMGFKTRI